MQPRDVAEMFHWQSDNSCISRQMKHMSKSQQKHSLHPSFSKYKNKDNINDSQLQPFMFIQITELWQWKYDYQLVMDQYTGATVIRYS